MKNKIKKFLILLFLVFLVSLFISVFIYFSRPLAQKFFEQEQVLSPYSATQNQNLNQNFQTKVPQEIKPVLEEKCSEKKSCFSTVAEVIDGDTIIISTGEKVRYIGINTPEIHHPTKKVECFGKEASEKNRELVLGKEVRLEKDISDKDKYGRLLRYVYVGELFVNDYLVRNGFANVATFPPNVQFKNIFLEAEKEARENGRGLWAENACKK